MGFRAYAAVFIFTAFTGAAHASDISDSDPEDLTNEADAAAAEVSEVKKQYQNEGNAAKSRQQAAAKAHRSAVAERARLVDQMKRKEEEIARLGEEQVRLKAETERMAVEAEALKKEIQERQMRGEKLKAETAALEALHAERVKALQRVLLERDKSVLELTEKENIHKQAEAAFRMVKDQEIAARTESQVLKAENDRKKARLDIQTADLNMQIAETQARIDNARMAKGTPGEARKPANVGMILKKTCRVFDAPTKGANVVGLQDSGTAVITTKEGKSWYAFNFNNGRDGYLAKSCFSSAKPD